MKLPVISGIETVKKLKKAGFIATRQRGSHVRLEKFVKLKTLKLTVPVHKTLKKGTISRIIKDAGLSIEEFLRL